VAGARYDNTLKTANGSYANNDAVKDANRALGFGGGGSGGGGGIASATSPAALSAADSTTRLATYADQGQGQFVAGRNAFQNGNQWVDSLAQKQPNAKHVRIQFNSAEYFALAAKEPDSLPWLALGQNVEFVLRGTVYEIYE
jgi:hypothetical protein